MTIIASIKLFCELYLIPLELAEQSKRIQIERWAVAGLQNIIKMQLIRIEVNRFCPSLKLLVKRKSIKR